MLDYLIVGSGLTGATIARTLHDAGKRVLVVERRDHMGGNVHDHQRNGIRVHTYGPHYFRTNNPRLWAWVHRYANFYRYEPALQTLVNGQLERWPVPASKIPPGWAPDTAAQPTDFEEASLAKMPESIYRDYVKGYTEKQWGQPAHTLSAELAGRFNVAPDDDPRLMSHRWQGIPVGGYTKFMARMLEGIPVELGYDWLRDRNMRAARHVVFTGPIDELHGFRLGKLTYRGQRRVHVWHETVQQPCGQVNNPGPGEHVRTLEWVHMLAKDERTRAVGSVTTTETPYTPDDPDGYEYPFPDQVNKNLYAAYRRLPIGNVTVCGRLGEYRYYDMDQAIGRAMVIARRLLGGRRVQTQATQGATSSRLLRDAS